MPPFRLVQATVIVTLEANALVHPVEDRVLEALNVPALEQAHVFRSAIAEGSVTPSAGMSGPGHILDLFHSLAALQLAGLGLIRLYFVLQLPVLVEAYGPRPRRLSSRGVHPVEMTGVRLAADLLPS